MSTRTEVLAKYNRLHHSDETCIVGGRLFRRHGDSWYPRVCAMCAHQRIYPPIPANCGADIVEHWNERTQTLELAFASDHCDPPRQTLYCAAYTEPDRPREMLNLDTLGVRCGHEVPAFCERFIFFFDGDER